MRTQTPLDGPSLEWAHNLLVLVGLVFPTKGCFQPSDLVAPPFPRILSFPFLSDTPTLCCSFPWLSQLTFFLSLSTSSLVFLHPPGPFLTQFFYLQLEVCGGFHDYILISLVWVGSDVIIPDIKSILLGMVIVALELISASK